MRHVPDWPSHPRAVTDRVGELGIKVSGGELQRLSSVAISQGKSRSEFDSFGSRNGVIGYSEALV